MSDLDLPAYDPATTVRTETIEINAPASVVWQVLVDLDNYGEWNPLCVSAESTLEIGAPLNMVLKDFVNVGQTYPWVEYICAVVPERLISWELLATDDNPDAARRDQVIEQVTDGSCAYYSTDAFFGETAAAVMAENGAWIKQSFEDTGVALKARAEELYALRAS